MKQSLQKGLVPLWLVIFLVVSVADIPFWERILGFDDAVTGVLRPRLLNVFQILFAILDTGCICRITPLPDALDVMLCPSEAPVHVLEESDVARV